MLRYHGYLFRFAINNLNVSEYIVRQIHKSI